MPPDLSADHRGQATGIGNFILALAVGSVLTMILWTVTDPLFNNAAIQPAADDSVGATANGWFESFVSNFPVFVLFAAFFSLLALAVFQREVLR